MVLVSMLVMIERLDVTASELQQKLGDFPMLKQLPRPKKAGLNSTGLRGRGCQANPPQPRGGVAWSREHAEAVARLLILTHGPPPFLE
jgi:hypothetical protein